MTLLVSVYKIDRQYKTILGDIDLPPGEDLGGFEVWRETVWGSDETVALGAVFLPELKEADLYIEGKDLTNFIRECEMLLEHYCVAKPCRQAYRKSIKHRLNNFIKAANRAILINGGISIS